MVSIWLVIIWASIMLFVSLISFIVIRRTLKESIDSNLSKLMQAETELVDELKQIDFSELEQTESGKQLLKLLSQESPHLANQFAPGRRDAKKEIVPKVIYEAEKTEPIVDSNAPLEKALIEEYLRVKGYSLEALKKLPVEVVKRLMKEAVQYASLKMEEIGGQAHFIKELHDDDASSLEK